MFRMLSLAMLAALAAVPARAACPELPAIARFAQAMLERRSPPPFPGLTPEDGACVQRQVIAFFAQPLGDVVGWKLGLTSAAAQQRLGVDRPVRGAIFFATLRAPSGSEVEAAFGAVPVVEADLLVRVSRAGLEAAGNDPVAILGHLDQVIPFIELADLVYAPEHRPSLGDLLAINVGARLGVVGTPIPVVANADFATRLGVMQVTLSEAGQPVARAPGSAILGHPLNAVAWLARDLSEAGRPLRPGDILSLGSFSAPQPARPGQAWQVTYEGLAAGEAPSVSVRLR
jgi:2-keto-4-pentenoate hydratase